MLICRYISINHLVSDLPDELWNLAHCRWSRIGLRKHPLDVVPRADLIKG